MTDNIKFILSDVNTLYCPSLPHLDTAYNPISFNKPIYMDHNIILDLYLKWIYELWIINKGRLFYYEQKKGMMI